MPPEEPAVLTQALVLKSASGFEPVVTCIDSMILCSHYAFHSPPNPHTALLKALDIEKGLLCDEGGRHPLQGDELLHLGWVTLPTDPAVRGATGVTISRFFNECLHIPKQVIYMSYIPNSPHLPPYFNSLVVPVLKEEAR